MTYLQTISSPLGPLRLASDGAALTGLWLEGQKYFAATLDGEAVEQPCPVFNEVCAWLEDYFAGKHPGTLPPLAPQGSEFRQAVWKLLMEIPYGQTVTYGDLTRQLQAQGRSAAALAVGGAVGHNPISILIPCHRVVGAGGSLTGYAGGIHAKEKLLTLEGVDLSRLFVPKQGTAL